jgi:acetoin utilization protein AcuB
MLVRNWMSKNPVTIDEEDSMQHASSIMREYKIRMLPVMRNGELVGIISDTDLKRASASDATMLDIHELLYLISRIKVHDIMNRDPITVPDDYTVEETAEVLVEHNISGVPVMDCNGRLVGIITRHDIFKILMSLSGLGKKGIQFAFQVDDTPGSIKVLTDVIRKHEGRIASILSSYEYAPEGKRIVYLRIYDIDRSVLPELVRELRQKGTLIYQVDHRDNKRLIFQDTKA